MLTRKYLESDEAKDIYLKLGRRCKKDILLLNQGFNNKGNVRVDLQNSSVETRGSNMTITQLVKLNNSDRIIKVAASKDKDCEFCNISLIVSEEGTDLLTGEGYSRDIASVNYIYQGDMVIITNIKDSNDIQKEEQARLKEVQRRVKASKVS